MKICNELDSCGFSDCPTSFCDKDDSSVGIYHLIDNGVILLPSDECLNDDCVTWWRLDSHPSGKHLIGNPHNVRFLCPMRRTGKRSPSEIEKILTK